jgi:hypothetical protein
MSSIKSHLDGILEITKQLHEEHTTEADEFVAVDEIKQAVNKVELTVHEARKVFERTKKIDEEPSGIQKS